MIIPTLVSVRKNSSSSSNAISGPGMLPFIVPVFMIAAGSVPEIIEVPTGAAIVGTGAAV
jgi:hypothetical protein